MNDPTAVAERVAIEAILDKRLVDLVDRPQAYGVAPGSPLLAEADACMRRIAGLSAEHARRLVDAMAGIGVVCDVPERQQVPSVTVKIDRACFASASQRLRATGFQSVDQLSAGATESRRRAASSARFAGTTGDGVQVTLAWGEASAIHKTRTRFGPGPLEWEWIDLPRWAWPVYHGRRIVNAGKRAVGIQVPTVKPVPHLPTPLALVAPLLGFAGITDQDVLLDLGCGDASVLIEAARSVGCKGVGVERNTEFVRSGRQGVVEAGLADAIEIRHADLADVTVEATAGFVFLPPRAVEDAIGHHHRLLPPGAVVVGHELARLPPDLPRPPVSAAPIFAETAMTVASKWIT